MDCKMRMCCLGFTSNSEEHGLIFTAVHMLSSGVSEGGFHQLPLSYYCQFILLCKKYLLPYRFLIFKFSTAAPPISGSVTMPGKMLATPLWQTFSPLFFEVLGQFCFNLGNVLARPLPSCTTGLERSSRVLGLTHIVLVSFLTGPAQATSSELLRVELANVTGKN